MSSRTVRADEHHPLPELGVLVGHLADALRIKGDLLDVPGVHPRTARRWFAGERIAHGDRDKILEAFYDAWLPSPENAADAPLASMLRPALGELSRRWDEELAELLTFPVPAEKPEFATLPLARLFLLDLAIRYGALRKSLEGHGLARLPADPLAEDLFARTLRGVQDTVGLVTVAELAEAAGVDDTTAQRWRATTLPSAENLTALERAVARKGASLELRVAMRLAVGVSAVAYALRALYCEFFDELARGVHEVAEYVYAAVRDGGVSSSHIVDLVVHGARSRVGRSMARDVADQITHPPPLYAELRLDLKALPGRWTGRLMHWAKALHVPDHSVQKLIREAPTFGTPASGPTPELLRVVAKEMPKLLWRITGFRDSMPAFEQAVRVKLPPKVAAFNWCEHANQAKSAGDLDTAIQHARTAIERNPDLGYAHFQLGAFLGEKLRDDPRLRSNDALLTQATTECRVGWQLDPTLPISLNEVGIILSNVGRFEEAEVAYAEAEGPCAELEHHHFCRARNHLALGDEVAALAGFERVLQLKPDHLQAMAHLSVLYQKHGRKRDSNTLADRLRQRVGEDPRDHAEDWLDPFYVRHLYVPRRGFRP